jgi:hypothetical protein
VTLHAPERPKRNSRAVRPSPDKLSRPATFRSRTDVGNIEARTGQGECSSISNTVQLVSGLPIVKPDDSDTRIRVSNGTTTRSDAVDPDKYHHAARLPRHPWHRPNAAEMTALRAESRWPPRCRLSPSSGPRRTSSSRCSRLVPSWLKLSIKSAFESILRIRRWSLKRRLLSQRSLVPQTSRRGPSASESIHPGGPP